MQGQNIPSRKQDHVELAVQRNVAFEQTTTGFERFAFEHNALPEIDFEETNPATVFLGKHLSFPLMITGMTGGYADAERINGALAEVCQEMQIAIGAGSQRQALSDDTFLASYAVLRRRAPGVPVIGNIGAAEVAKMQDGSPALRLVDMLEADALAVHLNPLQEFIQPEGNPQFRGVLSGIARLAKELPVPVIVKEVGAGISGDVARRLFDVGVRYIDVSGAGGTTWAGVELLRRSGGLRISPAFREWGIPTSLALQQVASIRPDDAVIIASGGVTDGMDIAKAISLGADLAGAARPLLRTLEQDGQDALKQMIESWKNDLRGAMFLTGTRSLDELRAVRLIQYPISPY